MVEQDQTSSYFDVTNLLLLHPQPEFVYKYTVGEFKLPFFRGKKG